jgi:hypothetical protein
MDANPEVEVSDFYPGVPIESGQSLKVAIGIQKEFAREEARRKKIEDMHNEWQQRLEEAVMIVQLIEPRVTAAQAEAERLQAVVNEIKATDLIKALGAATKEVSDLETELSSCYAKINPTVAGGQVDEEQREFFLRSEQAKTLRLRAARLTGTLKRAGVQHSSVRKQVATSRRLETHLVWTQIASLLENAKDDMELLFTSLDPGGDGTLPREDVESFLRLRWDVLSEFPEGDVALWLTSRIEKSRGTGLTREQLLTPKRVRYKVERAVAMTSAVSIKESSCVRRLNQGEFVEIMDAPQSDEEFDVTRIRIRALKDGAIGFVTIRGNQGTNYIEPAEGD